MERVSFVLVSVIFALNLSVQALFCKRSISHIALIYLSLYLLINLFFYRLSLIEDILNV